jgi:hypothetical protein
MPPWPSTCAGRGRVRVQARGREGGSWAAWRGRKGARARRAGGRGATRAMRAAGGVRRLGCCARPHLPAALLQHGQQQEQRVHRRGCVQGAVCEGAGRASGGWAPCCWRAAGCSRGRPPAPPAGLPTWDHVGADEPRAVPLLVALHLPNAVVRADVPLRLARAGMRQLDGRQLRRRRPCERGAGELNAEAAAPGTAGSSERPARRPAQPAGRARCPRTHASSAHRRRPGPGRCLASGRPSCVERIAASRGRARPATRASSRAKWRAFGS